MQNKQKYIDNLEIGLLVAFSCYGKIKSGKVLEIGPSVIKVQEYSGQLLYISKEDIIWVKTGKRWPRQIFEALRTGSDVCEQKD